MKKSTNQTEDFRNHDKNRDTAAGQKYFRATQVSCDFNQIHNLIQKKTSL